MYEQFKHQAVSVSDRHAVHARFPAESHQPLCGAEFHGLSPATGRDVSCKGCLSALARRNVDAASELRAQRAALTGITPAPEGFGGRTYDEAMASVLGMMDDAVNGLTTTARTDAFSAAMAQPCGDDKRPVLVAVPMSGRTGDVMVGGVTVALLHQDRESGLWTVEELGGKLLVNGAPYAESAVRAWALVTGITSPVDVWFRQVRNAA